MDEHRPITSIGRRRRRPHHLVVAISAAPMSWRRIWPDSNLVTTSRCVRLPTKNRARLSVKGKHLNLQTFLHANLPALRIAEIGSGHEQVADKPPMSGQQGHFNEDAWDDLLTFIE